MIESLAADHLNCFQFVLERPWDWYENPLPKITIVCSRIAHLYLGEATAQLLVAPQSSCAFRYAVNWSRRRSGVIS